jgi:hypothetical protein
LAADVYDSDTADANQRLLAAELASNDPAPVTLGSNSNHSSRRHTTAYGAAVDRNRYETPSNLGDIHTPGMPTPLASGRLLDVIA